MSGDGFYDINPSYNDDVSGLIDQTPSGGFEVPDTSSSPLYAGQAADVVNGDAMFSDFSVSADAILNDIESAPSRLAEPDVAGSDSLAKLGMEPLNVAGKPAESSWYQSALNALGLGGSGAAGGKGGGQDVGSLMSTVIVGNILKGLFAAPAQREAAKQNQRLVDSRVANESLQRGALTNQMNGLIGTAGGGATVAPYQPVQRPVYNPFKG
jgi:hypothetical protein